MHITYIYWERNMRGVIILWLEICRFLSLCLSLSHSLSRVCHFVWLSVFFFHSVEKENSNTENPCYMLFYGMFSDLFSLSPLSHSVPNCIFPRYIIILFWLSIFFFVNLPTVEKSFRLDCLLLMKWRDFCHCSFKCCLSLSYSVCLLL